MMTLFWIWICSPLVFYAKDVFTYLLYDFDELSYTCDSYFVDTSLSFWGDYADDNVWDWDMVLSQFSPIFWSFVTI